MKVEFVPAKDLKNQKDHGLSLADVHGLDWDHAVYRQDTRKDYGEERIQAYAYGLDDNKLYAVALTMRGDAVRIISFRRANKREERRFQNGGNQNDEVKKNRKGDKRH